MRQDTRGVGWFAIAFAAVVTAAFVGAHVAFAQAPPSPPHQFFGDAGSGSGATIDGALAPDGTLVTALNQDGALIATTTISGGLWLIQVDPEDATSVTFLLDNLVTTNPPIVVQSGALTAIALEAFHPVPPPPPHQFFGDAGAGTGATIDGALAPDGTLVTALNEAGAVIATTTISGGLWLIQVDPEAATSVTFLLDSLVTTNPPIVVQSGALTAVALEAFTTGRVQICHHAGRGGKARTLTVGARAALHHLAHGDSPGPCS